MQLICVHKTMEKRNYFPNLSYLLLLPYIFNPYSVTSRICFNDIKIPPRRRAGGGWGGVALTFMSLMTVVWWYYGDSNVVLLFPTISSIDINISSSLTLFCFSVCLLQNQRWEYITGNPIKRNNHKENQDYAHKNNRKSTKKHLTKTWRVF